LRILAARREAQNLSDRIDPLVQLPPLCRDLPLVGPRLLRRKAEVDLAVQMPPLRGHTCFRGFQGRQLLAEGIEIGIFHGACIDRHEFAAEHASWCEVSGA
jgi:hypothetical protein